MTGITPDDKLTMILETVKRIETSVNELKRTTVKKKEMTEKELELQERRMTARETQIALKQSKQVPTKDDLPDDDFFTK